MDNPALRKVYLDILSIRSSVVAAHGNGTRPMREIDFQEICSKLEKVNNTVAEAHMLEKT